MRLYVLARDYREFIQWKDADPERAMAHDIRYVGSVQHTRGLHIRQEQLVTLPGAVLHREHPYLMRAMNERIALCTPAGAVE